MEYILFFLWAIFGLISMYMAERRGRNQVLGFVAGAIFGILAVLYYLIAGDTVESRVAKEIAAKKKLKKLS